MDRRGFFKSLSLIGAAAVAPAIFIPKFEPVNWKISRAVINPDWIHAQREIDFLFNPSAYYGSWTFISDFYEATSPEHPKVLQSIYRINR